MYICFTSLINTNINICKLRLNITPRSPLEVTRHFGGTYLLPFLGRSVNQARNQRESRWKQWLCFPPVFTLISSWLIPRPCNWRKYVPPKRRLTFNRLQGVMFNKIVFVTITAVRTSNSTRSKISLGWNIIAMINFVDMYLKRRLGDCTLVSILRLNPVSADPD
jgi:hypothetical protein